MGLQDVLEQMPENQRRAILLREWQGLSYHEIADELDLPRNELNEIRNQYRDQIVAVQQMRRRLSEAPSGDEGAEPPKPAA